jgi:sugar/nucleoside kinase (ribokinase family)
MRTLCLGEALVDFVCEHAVDSPAQADAFVPRFGGDVANAAVTATRLGADIALAGGAGDDAWGAWLRDRLAAEGVALDWFGLLPGVRTPIAFVTVDRRGEPTFVFYGDVVAPSVRAVGARLPEAVTASDALFLTSNTLLGEQERTLALTARRQALDEGRHVVFDANLRPTRWASADAAVATVQDCVPGAALLKCNRSEAQVLTAVKPFIKS